MAYNPYVPRHVTQADGSPSQWTNCWAAVGAWLARGATRSQRRPTPSRFRRWARKPEGTTGGLADIERGLRAKGLWDRAVLKSDVPAEKIRERFLDRSGKLYAVETDFEVYPDKDSCQPGFTDLDDAYHMIGVVAGEGEGEHAGEVRVMDPLCRNFRWVDVDGVVDAIIQYNDEHSGEQSGTADLIVVSPPPKTGQDVPRNSSAEDDDDPEPPVEAVTCDEDELEMLLTRIRNLYEACKEA